MPEAATRAPQSCLVADSRGDLPEHIRQKVKKVPRRRFNRFRHRAKFDERVCTESKESQKADLVQPQYRYIANLVGDGGGDGGFTLSRIR